jgi:hypothetical protein
LTFDWWGCPSIRESTTVSNLWASQFWMSFGASVGAFGTDFLAAFDAAADGSAASDASMTILISLECIT